jgi:hypothetical protein
MHNRPLQTSAKPRARRSQSPYLLRPKCSTQVSLHVWFWIATTIDHGFLESQNFDSDISHWANSSSQVPVCSVEPGTPSDVGNIVNRSSRHCSFVADTSHVNNYSLSRLTSLVCRSQSRVVDIRPNLAFRQPTAYPYPRRVSIKLEFLKTRRLRLGRDLPGPMSMITSSQRVATLLEAA